MKRKTFINTIPFLFAIILLYSCAPQQSQEPCEGNCDSGVVGENPTLPEEYDLFRDVANPMGDFVDDYYSRYRELLKTRAHEGYAVDSCLSGLSGRNTFSDAISYMVDQAMDVRRSQLSYISSAYSLPASVANFYPVSLLSHPFCEVTKETLKTTLKGKVIPTATVAKAQEFTRRMNAFRERAYAGDKSAILGAQKLWTKTMMCLAYEESLTTADTKTSQSVADSLGLDKPNGVKFYMDPLQTDPDSKFNIGLFQFSPVASGNVQACLRAWNEKYASCSVDTKANFSKMVNTLASSKQVFNAFCGVTKIVDMFSVQVNTSKTNSTHPSNLQSGALRSPASRCVSPFFAAGLSYNHFGPLQNTVNDNLDSLLTCALRE